MNLLELLKEHSDHAIFSVLGLMSLIVLWKTIERLWFYWRVDVQEYRNEQELEIDLTHGLTSIYTVGANAPYVGLLGTVVGILITFYDMGQDGGAVEAGKIMLGLALALKATALGILVAIPSIIVYNLFSRRVEVNKLRWLAHRQS